MTSVEQIKVWTEKFGFDEGEVEILLRCHNSLTNPKDREGSFLNLMAHLFPYVFFFLPCDEIKNRINLVENHILPKAFGEKMKKAIFPATGDESESEAIELLLKGVADCCKGDADETLGVLFDCSKGPDDIVDPKDIIQLSYQLSISSEVLVSPNIDENRVLTLSQRPLVLHGLTNSLSDAATKRGGKVTKQIFVEWSKRCVPHLGAVLQGFIYNLVFHGKSSHSQTPPFTNPKLLDSSKIFNENNAGNLFAISCMSPDLGGNWRRLFSSMEQDVDLHDLETAISSYVGPSIFVIKTDSDHLIGGVAESGWKFGYFMFEIEPFARIHHATGGTRKYFIRHNVEHQSTAHGEKLEGSGFFANGGSSPDLFISNHFHWCKALFLDLPFTSKIEAMEVWGIETISEGESLKAPLHVEEQPHDPQ